MRFLQGFRTLIAIFPCASIVFTLPSCSDDACFPESKGKSYRVRIVEPWDSNSRFADSRQSDNPCPPQFDLISGSTFDFRVDAFGSGEMGCAPGKGSILASPNGWSWTDSDKYYPPDANGLFEEVVNAETDGCKGRTSLTIHVRNLPPGAAVPGEKPSAYLYRGFRADGCSAVFGSGCADYFVIELEEL